MTPQGVLHAQVLKLVQQIAEESGVLIETVQVIWIEVTTGGPPQSRVRSISLETRKKEAL